MLALWTTVIHVWISCGKKLNLLLHAVSQYRSIYCKFSTLSFSFSSYWGGVLPILRLYNFLEFSRVFGYYPHAVTHAGLLRLILGVLRGLSHRLCLGLVPEGLLEPLLGLGVRVLVQKPLEYADFEAF